MYNYLIQALSYSNGRKFLVKGKNRRIKKLSGIREHSVLTEQLLQSSNVGTNCYQLTAMRFNLVAASLSLGG